MKDVRCLCGQQFERVSQLVAHASECPQQTGELQGRVRAFLEGLFGGPTTRLFEWLQSPSRGVPGQTLVERWAELVACNGGRPEPSTFVRQAILMPGALYGRTGITMDEAFELGFLAGGRAVWQHILGEAAADDLILDAILYVQQKRKAEQARVIGASIATAKAAKKNGDN